MYSSGYSQVSKPSPAAQKRMQYRSKGKSCGYYMRIVFFFSSLIQSLIIVSLVLFLVYGKKQDSACTTRTHDLEESFSRLSIENVAFRQQRRNLTNLLNATMTYKARNDWDLAKLRHYANMSSLIIHEYHKKLQHCNTELLMCKASPRVNCDCTTRYNCNCGLLTERLKARLEFVESNFTQTVKRMRIEMDQTAKERDFINLEAIRLRRDKSTQEKELQFNKQKCKDEFFQSLSGVSNVSKAFLGKINSLFPTHLAFQLTCSKQREYLEQIRTNCTSLSREVEDKFQHYLNSVGVQLSDIHDENSRLKAENWRLSEDYRWCTQNRTGLIKEHKQNVDKLQQKHDQDKERLLMDKMGLNGEIQVLENNIKYKIKEVDHLTHQIKHLNMTCMSKTGLGGLGVGSTSRTSSSSQSGGGFLGGGGSSSAGQFGRAGSVGVGLSSGSSGSAFNKQGSSSSSFLSPGSSSSLGSIGSGLNRLGSTGTGSSSSSFLSPGSSSSLGSIGSGLNRLGSTGTGSSSSSFLSPGSSSSLGSIGSGLNKPGSTGTGSSSSSFLSPGSSSSLGSIGSGLNKPGSTGTGSSSSSFLSPGSSSSLGSIGSGLNKLGSTGTGSSSSSFLSPGSSSSLGSIGSGFNKPGSTGTGSSSSSFLSPGSSSSLGSIGSGFNKPGSTGTGSSSSSFLSPGSSSSLGSIGSGFNKQGSTGKGSSSSSFLSPGSSSSSSSTGSIFNKASSSGGSSSSLGSAGSSPSLSSSGIGSNKPTTSVKSSPGLGSSSGSTGSTSKSGSANTGFNWFGFGNNNAGQSKTGSGTAKGTSSGNSNSGTGSFSGAGRTSGLGGVSVNVAQHLQDLQRIINPSGPEENQDLSRMLG
ncbi:plasmalemma vesicle associated protein a isoform X2 [Scophthalmus maximus]|uniref:plasmalemma vesicle associated protein a isoform X2 n=1 Tax=Scophthalmus maximus TaxID=52904 RepID=UPI001FA8FD9F|nr:plasmalemma vesicle associated protein a isoform X2 [Scophthalmus maximus]